VTDGLHERGYAVVAGVVGPDLVASALAVLRERTGIALDDPASWAGAPGFPPLWATQAQWDIRQSPRVHAAFAAAWGDADLRVSIDGMGFKPPLATALAGRYAGAMPLHFDLDPREGRHSYQGVVYLTDVGPDDGAFRCVPGVFADLAGWLARHPGFEPGAWEEPDLEEHDIVHVPACAGDLVIFDSRLLHGNAAHHGAAPRVVQYVAMTPPGFWSEGPNAWADLYRSGRAPEHFRPRPGWEGPAPDPPARLTDLGQRLVGLA
jgi:hypothetical protein